MSKPYLTRFAPSPSGLLHLGHAYSAALAYRAAERHGGTFILRLEDIDVTRCRPEFEDAIAEDLHWLGIKWPQPVRRQSDHFADYREGISILQDRGLLYPCFCTRKDIAAEIERSASAPHGPDGVLYPGTCKGLSHETAEKKIAADIPYALRLDMDKALQQVAAPLAFVEKGKLVAADPGIFGDPVIARKDVPTSYHLAVVWDDHLQGVTNIIRGEDLLHATHLHRLLQALFGFAPPEYYHHALLTGKDGKRFAKRDKSLTLRDLRETGHTPGGVYSMMADYGGAFDQVLF